MADRRSRLALAAFGLVILCWTAGGPLFLMADTEGPVFVAWRLGMAAPVLVLMVWRMPALGPHVVPPRRWELLVGSAAFGLAMVFGFVAVGSTTLANAVVIGNLAPVVLVPASALLLGERVGWWRAGLAAVAVAGAVVIATASSGTGTWSLKGDVLAAISMLLFCVWSLLARRVRVSGSIDPIRLMAWAMVTSFVVVGVIVLVTARPPVPEARALPWIAATAVFGTTGHLLAVWTQRYLPVSLTSVLALGQLPLAAIAAAMLFDEPIGAGHIIGGAIVMGALGFLVRSHAAEHRVPTVDEYDLDEVVAPAPS